MTTEKPDILFHYCSNESFLSIIKDREITASALTLSNDAMEGKWIETVFRDICKSDPVLSQHQQKLNGIVESLTKVFGGLGFCLSEDGDLLSQWRGYADNAAGVSLGFNTGYLTRIVERLENGGALQQVVYDPVEQAAGLNPMIADLKALIAKGALKEMMGSLLIPTTKEEQTQIKGASEELWVTYLRAFPKIYAYKNPAFREEREWRLIYYLVTPDAQSPLNLLDHIDFRAKHDRLIPIQRVKLKEEGDIPIISQVILGPRNITPDFLVTAALNKCGFKGVKVTKSEASYR